MSVGRGELLRAFESWSPQGAWDTGVLMNKRALDNLLRFAREEHELAEKWRAAQNVGVGKYVAVDYKTYQTIIKTSQQLPAWLVPMANNKATY